METSNKLEMVEETEPDTDATYAYDYTKSKLAKLSSKNWIIVINNWCQAEFDKLVAYPADYKIIGQEVGVKKKTPHLQCYFHFHASKDAGTLKNEFPRAWLAKARGSAVSNQKYCSKENNFLEFGILPVQGKRSDVDQAIDELRAGKELHELTDLSVVARYPRGLTLVKSLMDRPKMRDNINVIWIWGPSGVGKTRSVFDKYGFDKIYIKSSTEKWWDGYTNSVKCVLIDDFRTWPVGISDLLQFLQEYPYQGPFKGGFLAINCENIVFTSDRSPEDAFYALNASDKSQVLRRIHSTVWMEAKKPQVVETSPKTAFEKLRSASLSL